MSVIYKVYTYLQKIKNNEVSFTSLINKGLKGVTANELLILRDSLKSIVNKYFFLMWEANKIYSINDEHIKDYFICALGIYHYVKTVDQKDIFAAIEEDKKMFAPEFDIEEMQKAISSLNNETIKLSERDNDILIKRLAYNYAYPEWVVKMVFKHFSIKNAYKAVASSRKNINITVNHNSFLTNIDKLLNTGSFEKGVLSDKCLRCISKDKVIDLPEFKKNLIFVESEVNQLLIDKLNLEAGDEALLFAKDKGPMTLDMALSMKDMGCLHVVCKDLTYVQSVRAMANRFRLHILDIIETNLNLLLTHIGKETCDKILLIPESTNLGLIRRHPEYLLTLKRDDLDSIIENQKRHINEVSEHLKVGGRMVYAVYTYNKKESTLVIEEFLANHPNFTLIEEKQIFAHEVPSDGVYYAVLERNN